MAIVTAITRIFSPAGSDSNLIKTFKVYPSLLGVTIDDDRAELSSRMNDHPRIYVFRRRQPRFH
jgi:hypothetical protein